MELRLSVELLDSRFILVSGFQPRRWRVGAFFCPRGGSVTTTRQASARRGRITSVVLGNRRASVVLLGRSALRSLSSHVSDPDSGARGTAQRSTLPCAAPVVCDSVAD